MADNPKDTIYIDIDDEITGIIDKLRASSGKIVALVLPKRASVFQSVVNMKLLKKAAEDAKKHLVLITSEAGLLPLAGLAGIHVAKTLTTKPEIPAGPRPDDGEETIQEEAAPLAADGDEPEVTAVSAGDKPIGDLAGLPAAADSMETVELDNDEPEEAGGEAAAGAAGAAAASKTFEPSAKTKANKKLHVPNFERFRLLLALGVLIIILLIVGLVFAANILPKAVINISTNATNVPVNLNLNLSTSANTADPSTNTVPAKLVQQQKTYSQQVPTTGQKNEGQPAKGTVTMTDCVTGFSFPSTVPAGTGITTSSGATYITQEDTTFSHSGTPNGSCFVYQSTSSTDIVAQSGGASYNVLSGTNFTVNGRKDVSASGSATGGTDNVVQVVSQNDITAAQSKISTSDTTVKQALANQLNQDGYYAIAATFSSGTPTTTNSANPGDTASSVTVTETVTYTMFGVYESDLKTLVDNSVKGQIDTSKQSILSEGLSAATFGVNSASTTSAQLTMQTNAIAGPELNTDTIKQEVMGKKSGDVKTLLETNPDVTGVSVKLSPFWVTTVPKKASKITINIAKPKTTVNNSSGNANNP